jgi:hypothetical protein
MEIIKVNKEVITISQKTTTIEKLKADIAKRQAVIDYQTQRIADIQSVIDEALGKGAVDTTVSEPIEPK